MSETDIELNARIRGVDSGVVNLRQIALGLMPVIVIDIDQNDEGAIKIDIDATGPDTPEELADFFDMAVYALRQGIDTSGNKTWDLGDREPEGVTVVDETEGGRWIRSAEGTWAIDELEPSIEWSELVRRYGPVRRYEPMEPQDG